MWKPLRTLTLALPLMLAAGCGTASPPPTDAEKAVDWAFAQGYREFRFPDGSVLALDGPRLYLGDTGRPGCETVVVSGAFDVQPVRRSDDDANVLRLKLLADDAYCD